MQEQVGATKRHRGEEGSKKERAENMVERVKITQGMQVESLEGGGHVPGPRYVQHWSQSKHEGTGHVLQNPSIHISKEGTKHHPWPPTQKWWQVCAVFVLWRQESQKFFTFALLLHHPQFFTFASLLYHLHFDNLTFSVQFCIAFKSLLARSAIFFQKRSQHWHNGCAGWQVAVFQWCAHACQLWPMIMQAS